MTNGVVSLRPPRGLVFARKTMIVTKGTRRHDGRGQGRAMVRHIRQRTVPNLDQNLVLNLGLGLRQDHHRRISRAQATDEIYPTDR